MGGAIYTKRRSHIYEKAEPYRGEGGAVEMKGRVSLPTVIRFSYVPPTRFLDTLRQILMFLIVFLRYQFWQNKKNSIFTIICGRKSFQIVRLVEIKILRGSHGGRRAELCGLKRGSMYIKGRSQIEEKPELQA